MIGLGDVTSIREGLRTSTVIDYLYNVIEYSCYENSIVVSINTKVMDARIDQFNFIYPDNQITELDKLVLKELTLAPILMARDGEIVHRAINKSNLLKMYNAMILGGYGYEFRTRPVINLVLDDIPSKDLKFEYRYWETMYGATHLCVRKSGDEYINYFKEDMTRVQIEF